MADIFDELTSDFRAEQTRRIAMRLAIPAAILAVLAGAGVVGWQVWRGNQAQQAVATATAYAAAARDAGGLATADAAPTPARAAAQAEFDRLAASAPPGYRTLARLRAAALRASAGDLPGALAGWDALANDTEADPALRDLARLLAAQHCIDAGEPPVVEARLQPLLQPGNPWRPLAQEVQALLAMRTGRTDDAKALFRTLSTDQATPPGVRSRAGALLIRLGDPPPPASAGAGG